MRGLKWIGLGLGGVVLLIGALVVGASVFFNPNDYRELIANKASKALGHKLELQGNLSAQFFPHIAIKAENVVLHASNQVSDKPLASIAKMKLKVQTLPLLRQEVLIDAINISEADIHLVKNQQGENWQAVQTQAHVVTDTVRAVKVSTQSHEASPSWSANLFEITQVSFENCRVEYTNAISGQAATFEKLNLSTGAIALNQDIEADGDFAVKASDAKRLAEGEAKFKVILRVSGPTYELKTFTLESKIDSAQLPHTPMAIDFKGQAKANLLNAQATFSNLALSVDDVNANGGATLDWKGQPRLAFDLNVDSLDADHWIKGLSKPQASLSPRIEHASFEGHGLSIEGNIKVGQLKAKGIKASQVSLTARSHPKGLLLKPLKASLYGGGFDGESLINGTNDSVSVQGKLGQITMAELLTDLGQKPTLTGTGHANLNLVIDSRGLNGSVNLKVANGFIHGIDLDYYLRQARALLKQLPMPSGDRKKTDYQSITATLNANANVLTNNDLLLIADDLRATGDGTIDLNQKALNYRFFAERVYNDGAEHPNALPLAVRVSGPFDKLKITPDMDAYLKTIVERQLKDELNEQVNKQLDKLIKKPDAQDGSNAIEQEIEKGIKKLFKF